MGRHFVGLHGSTNPKVKYDNRGQWYLARAKKPVQALEDAFANGHVGAILYDRIGGLLQGPRPYIYVQVRHVTDQITVEHGRTLVRECARKESPWPEWTVTTCLTELGVSLIRPLNFEELLSSPTE